MKLQRTIARTTLALVAAVAVAACVTVFPKQPPVQLYEFGRAAAPASATQPAPARLAIALSPIDFERAAAGDRILTAQGDQSAYIRDARWVSAAPVLFEASVRQAFAAHGGAVRLLDRGEPARADGTLKLDVRAFEAHYGADMNSPPTIRIEVYAAMGMSGQPTDHSKVFVSEALASDNRVGAIARAFDEADAATMAKLIAWVDAGGQT